MLKMLLRHRRGEYPLGRAFWLHGFVTWVLVDASVVGIALGNPDDGSLTAKAISVFSLSVIVMLAWLFVGIWRSASRERKAGRLFWPFMAQCWIVSLVAAEIVFAAIMFGSRPDFG